MGKGIAATILSLVIIIGLIIVRNLTGPDITPYMHLVNPAFRTMAPQRMLVVEAQGAPDKAAKKAFSLLMRTYYKLKLPASVPPRARWPQPESVPEEQWIGRYAMPIPDTIQVIKLPAPTRGLSLRVTTWEYGEVAEILHIGPYDRETPTIDRLKRVIATSGYSIIGEHEEEYLKGPGLLFR
ncbi:MAG: hypothetical protein MUF22_02905, partial [Chitinispirillaceae bacterium]|nr:hypothetical protein [Chitinispirillaceae bacterium]